MASRISRQNTYVYFIDNDDSYIRDVLARFEEVNDYNISIYTRSKEFFEDFSVLIPSKRQIDIIFLATTLETDQENQMVEPIVVLKKIKEINPYAEVILYSENDDINMVSSAFHYGAYTFIKKNENITLRIINNIKGIISQRNFLLKKEAGIYMAKLFLLFFSVLIVLFALLYYFFPELFSF
jgi:DNA-binding NtrC family response regulator